MVSLRLGRGLDAEAHAGLAHPATVGDGRRVGARRRLARVVERDAARADAAAIASRRWMREAGMRFGIQPPAQAE